MYLETEKVYLWIITQKLKAYFLSSPFKEEKFCFPVYETIGKIPHLKSSPQKPIPQEIPHQTSNTWTEFPLISPTGKIDLLILSGIPRKEELEQRKTLLIQEEESLSKWMKAVGIQNFGVQAFPWQDKTISFNYKKAKHWISLLIEKTQAKFILTLGEDGLYFFTGYPILLEFTHGIDFPFILDDRILIVFPTYSIRDVLINPDLKRIVWRDLKRLLGIIRYETP